MRDFPRIHQLVGYIKNLDKKYAKKNDISSFAAVEKFARKWLEKNKPRKVDIASRYDLVPKRPKKIIDASKTNVKALPSEPEPARKEGEVPACPLCGAPMVLRTARYGKNKGNKFWGCSTYRTTRCKGIVNVE